MSITINRQIARFGANFRDQIAEAKETLRVYVRTVYEVDELDQEGSVDGDKQPYSSASLYDATQWAEQREWYYGITSRQVWMVEEDVIEEMTEHGWIEIRVSLRSATLIQVITPSQKQLDETRAWLDHAAREREYLMPAHYGKYDWLSGVTPNPGWAA